jgi:murein DD-endopeptidase MepM/ murein hydrolase activator NlpD
VRLALYGAAVGCALTIPGLAGAGDPRLLFDIRPPTTVVLENGGRRDALLSIDVANPGDRRVRVERVRATYYAGETAVGTLDPATSIFTRAGLLSDPRVEPAGKDRWEGLCLAPPTPAVDRVRFEFDLVERRGVRNTRATQALDGPLRAPVSPPVIALPVSGTWRVTQGHTCDTNHRRGRLGGEFAWDLAAVTETGGSGAPGFDRSHRNDESATFGRPVLAPAAGTIVSVVDGVEDNDAQREFPRRSLVESAKEPRWIFGNYLVLDAGGGVFVLLAHLKRGSIVVSPGAVVRVGDPLAQAGNSGNTMLPHVHVQVMDRADPAASTVSGIPALFRNYVEILSRGEKTDLEATVRRVAAGDPPEGAIVKTWEATPHAP